MLLDALGVKEGYADIIEVETDSNPVVLYQSLPHLIIYRSLACTIHQYYAAIPSMTQQVLHLLFFCQYLGRETINDSLGLGIEIGRLDNKF